jgi:hypothetical protein
MQGVRDALILRLAQGPALFIVYFFEFGLYFLVAWYCLRREMRQGWKITTQQCAMWVMFTVCLVIVSVVSSDSTGSNDLGFRGILIMQFVLLIWAAPLVSEFFLPRGQSQLGNGWKIAFLLSIILGTLGTFTQLAILRLYAPIIDAGIFRRTDDYWMGPTPGLGEHTLRMRESLERLKAIAPPSAVLQYSPVGQDLFLFHLYADRQTAVGDESCGTSFGGDSGKCQYAYQYVHAAFNAQEAARTWNMDRFCDEFNINILVATDTDPIWNDKASWVWTRTPLLATDALRAISCGTHSPPG